MYWSILSKILTKLTFLVVKLILEIRKLRGAINMLYLPLKSPNINDYCYLKNSIVAINGFP